MLIDFVPIDKGKDLKDVNGFERVAGGAPMNVVITASKLGIPSAMISKVANDSFGDYLVEILENNKVDTSYIVRTSTWETSLAFVSVTMDGERDFSFYRKNAADLMLEQDEVEGIEFQEGDILHFGSVDLVESPMKETHRKLLLEAKHKGGIVSFDTNVRLQLWENENACREAILEFLPYTDVVKVSEEELYFITGESSLENGVNKLFTNSDLKAVVSTFGDQGSMLFLRSNVQAQKNGYAVKVEDTNGAGDAFMAGFLAALIRKSPLRGTLLKVLQDNADEILSYANATGAIMTTVKGAYHPTLDDRIVQKQLAKATDRE